MRIATPLTYIGAGLMFFYSVTMGFVGDKSQAGAALFFIILFIGLGVVFGRQDKMAADIRAILDAVQAGKTVG